MGKRGYDRPMKTTVAAMDFGTSKIVTLVAENSGSQRCDIVGAGIAPYDGYLEEGWNNPGELDKAIRASVAEAESQSHHRIREVNVGVPGAFTKVYATEARIDLKGTDPRVTPGDIKAVFKKAAEDLGQFPGIVVHRSPAWFRVDDGKRTLERPVRETPKRTTKLNSHAYSSTLGLMDLIIDTIEQQHQPSAGVGGAIKDFFRSLLGG